MSTDDSYLGTVVDAEMIVLNSGKEAICIGFEIEGKGRLTWTGYFHTDPALEFTEKALKTLEFDLRERDYNFDACCSEIIGRKASLVLEEREYNDNKYLRIRYVNSVKGGGAQEMSSDQANALSQRLRGEDVSANGEGVPF